MDQLTDWAVYRRRYHDDLRVVTYNLQMMMDWEDYTLMLNTVALDLDVFRARA